MKGSSKSEACGALLRYDYQALVDRKKKGGNYYDSINSAF